MKSLETSFIEAWTVEEPTQAQTQTEGISLREIQGLNKAGQSIAGELTNILAKLADHDEHIAKEKQKIQEAGDDEFQKERINERIKTEDERSVRFKAANKNKNRLRGQINTIRGTINNVLKEDTTLGKRLKTLVRDHGITIASVLNAIGMIIGAIVEAVIPSGTTSGSTLPKPSSQGDVKDLIQNHLHNFGKLLADLAGKAAVALPDVIGSIGSWLLSATGKVCISLLQHYLLQSCQL